MPTDLTAVGECAQRADAAEAALLTRHVRRLWALPGTRLGVCGWPASVVERALLPWNYWWQAHLLDCFIDAANRAPTAERRKRIRMMVRGMRTRNLTGWTNRYYDDMAWLVLALERADRTQGISYRHGIDTLAAALLQGWNPKYGAIVWRVNDDFYNAPANGPAGIALARLGRLDYAIRLADWLDSTLRDKETGLILDGVRLPAGNLERSIFTYCQGVTLGLEIELALRTGAPRHQERAEALTVAAIAGVTTDGVINGDGGGDGGLFGAILARYLTLTAIMLPGETATTRHVRAEAARVVHTSAQAAWENRAEVKGMPLFGPEWARPAEVPESAKGAGKFIAGTVSASSNPARDLTVQTAAWMLLEADYQLTAAGM